ncbi:MAG: AAA family ATPase [Defluviitaleaceae bacterium]|nr:AAA family ATPase [Defluviitaleaceae bacterium]
MASLPRGGRKLNICKLPEGVNAMSGAEQTGAEKNSAALLTEEKAYLENVLEYLQLFLDESSSKKNEIDDLVSYGRKHYNSDNAEQFVELSLNINMQEVLVKRVTQAAYALNKPYFARVDFVEDGDASEQKYYIGKMSLMRELELLITDWRAPIATLYYEGRLGSAEYECPDGIIAGEITLKRQYAIEKGILQSFGDIDITTNDSFLQAALGASKDRRLKDIVTTIQAEQNRVIRAPLFEPLIVQGAAGGGKTTIALHRIAYLLYTHEQSLQPKHVMIMAPNRFFLSYISEVLPDLGVERVVQTTFEDYAAECIGLSKKKWSVTPDVQHLARIINDGKYTGAAFEAARLKGGMRFLYAVKKYCEKIERSVPPKEDFGFEEYELFTHEAVEDLFLREYRYLPVAKRVNEIKKNLKNTLKKEKPLIIEKIESDCESARKKLKKEMDDGPERRSLIIKMLDERDEKIKRVKYKAAQILPPYIKKFAVKTAAEYYCELFSNAELLTEICSEWFTPDETEAMRSHTAQTLAENKLDTADLPPLLWMQIKLFGLGDVSVIKHAVIDEAQDFSLFQFSALKAALKSESFSILGDIHQGIYSHKGVNDWAEVEKNIFPVSSKKNGVKNLTLVKSYRTTVEIMEAANPVIAKLYENEPAISLAEPVIRHGERVALHRCGSPVSLALEIEKKIAECESLGYRSVAVICKTESKCKFLQKTFKRKMQLININEEMYGGGFLIVPAYLAKGLEFDAVLIADAEAYSGAEQLDIKLLYIAMTRALHLLEIFYEGDPPSLIKHLVN